MSEVNYQLVREFFELNRFNVLTHWQRDPGKTRSFDHGQQLLVENTDVVAPLEPLEAVLSVADVRSVKRAVVEIRAWHGEPFYPSVIESSPILWQFAKDESLAFAEERFGHEPYATILVISDLPSSPKHRARSIKLFEESPVDHVLEFPTILQGLLEQVSVNSPYSASNTLQLLRILKRYRYVRNQQMEFPFPLDAPEPAARNVEAVEVANREDEA